ncbi:MAG: GDP-mannose 4,6-dehydratase [Anaerolineae bacterium]|nr:GDP-mannose 4,6-dehydratase [Anaerolineae bacterium]
MTYLVTGGAGFIGSHVAKHLLERGEAVVILDNFNDYYDPKIKRNNVAKLSKFEKFTVVEGDVRDTDLIDRIFAEHGIKKIAHLAAMANVRASIKQAPLYTDVNVIGTMNLLEASAKHGLDQFVLASTSSVYGATNSLPFVETDTADKPLASYPASKRAAEIFGHTYHNLHDMNVTCLRFFNVYGPAGRPDMMPMKLLHAAQDGSLITMFNGGDIHRDWTYIDDTVDGVIAALETPLGYEVLNLGCGNPISLKDFVEVIEELSGKEINKTSAPTPPSDPPMTYCDNQKARDLLGFKPQTSVQEGLAKTWAWFREFYKIR